MRLTSFVSLFIVLPAIALLSGCERSKAMESKLNEENSLIKKEYGIYTPYPTISCSERPYTNEGHISDYKLKSCSLSYMPQSRTGKWSGLKAEILEYDSKEYQKDDITLIFFKGAHIGSEVDYKKLSGKKVIEGCSKYEGGPCYARWISGNFIITLRSEKTSIPDEMKKDYLSKYPPTDTFTEEDFDEQSVMKHHLGKKIKFLNKLEKGRRFLFGKKGKEKEWYIMVSQCEQEKQARCWLGLTDDQKSVDCPATKTLDRGERAELWDELIEASNKKKIVLDNIDWDNPQFGNCPNADRVDDQEIRGLLGIED